MTKKIMVGMAMLILAGCLLSGGCSKLDDNKINSWKDLINIPASGSKTTATDDETLKTDDPTQTQVTAEQIKVKLYFMDAEKNKLVAEERSISKAEGIARITMQELLKGPVQQEHLAIFPNGTKLLDINVKSDGLCIVDLSSEVNNISNEKQGNLMIQAVVNTMSQFPAIKNVSFLINGEKVNKVGGIVDVSQPIGAD